MDAEAQIQSVGIEKRLDRFRKAAYKGRDWLLQFANPDGSIGPVQERLFYYRLPWTLALVGEIGTAHLLLGWIRDHMISAAGEFAGISPQGIFAERYGSYPLACLLMGTSMLQRYDLVYPCLPALERWQDPETGGFRNGRSELETDTRQEIFPTAQGGMACLQVGNLQAAMRAGSWLERLWKAQPDPEHRLFHVYSTVEGLINAGPEEEEALYITRKDDPWQHHFNGGIAAAFLTQFHMATKHVKWLDLAKSYQAFSMTTAECQFESKQVCKSGWGAGLLYVATGDPAYARWTVRLGDWFVDEQLEDGHWENTPYWNPQPTVADNIEITAEFVMHLANLISYLSERVDEPQRVRQKESS